MTCRHSYRKETNLSDIHDFDSSQLSCPLVTALCSTQINRSYMYFVATTVLIMKRSKLIDLAFAKMEFSSLLVQRMNECGMLFFFRLPKTLTFKMRLSAQTFLRKLVLFGWEWNIISISKAEHLIVFWYRGPEKLRNGILPVVFWTKYQ